MSISSSKNVARYLLAEVSKSEPGSKGIFKNILSTQNDVFGSRIFLKLRRFEKYKYKRNGIYSGYGQYIADFWWSYANKVLA